MNIFIFSEDIEENVKSHCDKHCVKMIVEYAQLLSTAHHLKESSVDLSKIYKPTHKNHPSTLWTISSEGNYNYLYNLFIALSKEYSRRYKRVHKTFATLGDILKVPPKGLRSSTRSSFAIVVSNNQDTSKGAVEAYREYFVKEKRHIATWKYSEVPKWFLEKTLDK